MICSAISCLNFCKSQSALGHNPYHFKTKADAMGRAKKVHMCTQCFHNEMSNYGKTCPSCGVTKKRVCFSSKVEHRYAALLLQMQGRREISQLRFHPRYPLIVNGSHVTTYIADGEYIKDGMLICFDVKPRGLFMDKLAELKINLFEAIYKQPVHIVRKA